MRVVILREKEMFRKEKEKRKKWKKKRERRSKKREEERLGTRPAAKKKTLQKSCSGVHRDWNDIKGQSSMYRKFSPYRENVLRHGYFVLGHTALRSSSELKNSFSRRILKDRETLEIILLNARM